MAWAQGIERRVWDFWFAILMNSFGDCQKIWLTDIPLCFRIKNMIGMDLLPDSESNNRVIKIGFELHTIFFPIKIYEEL